MNKPNLKQERMSGAGSCGGINYLKGLDDLCKFFKLDKSKIVLELGVNTGISTSLFAFYAKEVVGVDIIKTDEFEDIIKKCGNVSLKHGSVAHIVPELPAPYLKRKDVKDIEKMDIKLLKVIKKSLEIK